MEALHRERILQAVAPPPAVELLPGALRPHREWVATYLSVWVQAYNTTLVKKAQLPRSFEDLLDPKWKGKLGIEARVPEWYASVVIDMGEEKGSRFFRELVAKNGILGARRAHAAQQPGHRRRHPARAHRLPVPARGGEAQRRRDRLVRARAGGGAHERRRHRAACAASERRPAVLRIHAVAEAQQLLLSRDYVPTTGKLPGRLASHRIKLVDPAAAMDQYDRWLKAFEDVIVKRSAQ